MRVGRILTARPVVKGARSGKRRRNSPGPSSVVRSWPKAASFAHVSSFLWPLAFTAATGRRSSLQRPGSRLSDAVELRYVQNDDVAFSLFLVLGLPRSPGRPRWDRSGRNRRDPRPRRRAVTARRRRRQARAREGGAARVRARHRRRAGERRRPDRARIRHRLHPREGLARLQRRRHRRRRRDRARRARFGSRSTERRAARECSLRLRAWAGEEGASALRCPLRHRRHASRRSGCRPRRGPHPCSRASRSRASSPSSSSRSCASRPR